MKFKPSWLHAAVLSAICISSAPALAYSVSGGQIYDDTGARVTLRGVNWFGFETETRVAHGLWARNWKDMIGQMQSAGFNAVRLPICPANLRAQAANSIDFSRNPDLQGLNSLQLLDTIVAELDRRGMHVLIDHHRPDCNAISELWYTDGYTEAQWIADLRTIAQRYKGYRHFLGIDLKNEPHGRATWGTGNVATDWNLAAERAAKAVITEAPQALVFVEGIGDQAVCATQPGTWWGGNLAPLACKNLDIPLDRLVLSPHVYGPDVYAQTYFSAADFPNNLPAIWQAHFGQLAGQGYAIAIGETGGKYGAGQAKDRAFQDALFGWLKGRGLTNVFYWSWNPNSGDTGGILQDDWNAVRSDKVALLRSFWSESLGAAPAPAPAPPAPAPPAPAPAPSPIPMGPLNVALIKASDWGSGYCANVGIRNSSSAPQVWRVDQAVEGRIYTLWNAVWQQTGARVTASGVDWNATVAPGGTVEFGFCANR